MAIQFDARFTGRKQERRPPYKVAGEHEKRNITVFALSRVEAMDEVLKQAAVLGFTDVSIDHMTKVG